MQFMPLFLVASNFTGCGAVSTDATDEITEPVNSEEASVSMETTQAEQEESTELFETTESVVSENLFTNWLPENVEQKKYL